ncbi:MAG: hemolysin family protein [Candidatus Omnitrophota bacterium]
MSPFSIIILLGFFVLLTGFFSGSETALMSLNRVKLRHLADSGNRNAKIVQGLLDDPDHLFIAILAGTNLSIVLASSVFSAFLVERMNPYAEQLTTLIMTPLLLVFGEVIPKSLFRHNAFFLVTTLTPLLRLSCAVFFPIARALQAINDVLLRLLGQRKTEKEPLFATKAELKYLIQETEKEGILQAHERSIVYKIFELGEKEVRKMMVPVSQVVALSSSATIGEMIGQLRKSRFSWLPIYEGKPSAYVGFVSLFDVAYEEDVDKPLKPYVRPLVSVREEKAIDEVLVSLQKQKCSMAIVENADQCAVGLVTLEDLLHEIIGGA